MLGTPVTLNINGKSKFTTNWGAFVTVLIVVFVIYFAQTKFIDMVTKHDPNLSKTTFFQDLDKADIAINPFDTGFEFLFRVMSNNTQLTPDIATLGLQYTKQVRGQDNKFVKKKLAVPFGPCTNEHLVPQAAQLQNDQLDFSQFNCAYLKNITLGGNYYAPFFDYVKFEINICQGGVENGCKSDPEIKARLQNAKVEVMFFNSYIDFFDWEKPQQLFLDDRLFFYLDLYQTKSVNVFVKKSELVANDALFTINDDDTRKVFEFHQVENIREYSASWVPGQALGEIFLRLDPATDTNRRLVYNFFDFCGDIGGVLEIVGILGALFVSAYSENRYFAEILKKIYHVKTYTSPDFKSSDRQADFRRRLSEKTKQLAPPRQVNGKVKKIPLKNLLHSQTKQTKKEQHESGQIEYEKSLVQRCDKFNLSRLHEELELEKYKLFKRKLHLKTSLTKQDGISMLNTILSRERLKYTILLALYYFACCLCLRKRALATKEKFKAHHLFEKGKANLESELNIFNMLNQIREHRLLASTLLDQKQKFLLNFQRNQLIESNSTENSEDLDAMENLKHKNPMIKMMQVAKMKRRALLYAEESNLTDIDKRLIIGLYKRRLHPRDKYVTFPHISPEKGQAIERILKRRMQSVRLSQSPFGPPEKPGNEMEASVVYSEKPSSVLPPIKERRVFSRIPEIIESGDEEQVERWKISTKNYHTPTDA